jgi:hypothetical protein
MADDTTNSTAVTPEPVQQSTTPTDTTTNPPAPTPTQQPSGADTQASGDSGAPDTSLQPQGTYDTQQPSTAGTGAALQPQTTGDNQVAQPTPPAPMPAPADAQAQAQPMTFTQKLLKTSAEIFKAMGGGDQYTTSIDANGNTTRTPVKMDKTHLGLAIALEALQGGLAAAPAHGTNATGAGAAAGLEQGEKIGEQRAQVQEQADQKAQQDYVRKFETTKANLQMFETMQAVGKHSFDVANAPVEAYKAWLENLREKNKDMIADPDVNEQEALSIEQHSMHELMRIPTVTLHKLDNDGKPLWTNNQGNPVPPNTLGATPAWDYRFAMVHRDADGGFRDAEGNVLPAVQKQIAQGKLPDTINNSAQDAQVPLAGLVYNTAKVEAANGLKEYLYGDHGVVQLANMYRDRRDAMSGTAPNAYDPAKDSIYDVFGGNVSALSDFVQSHASPQAIKDNNPAMIPAGDDWTGDVDRTGPVPIRIYPDKDTGAKATDVYLTSRQQSLPKESVTDFLSSVTGGAHAGNATSIQPVVEREAKANGLDPNVVNALIATESSFKPGANGSDTDPKSTAKGLMQVNNPTAKTYGLDPDKMYDPEYAVQAGTKVLAAKIKDAGGDVRKGLMNYFGSDDDKKNAAYADGILSKAAQFKDKPSLLQQYEGNQGNQDVASLAAQALKINGATNVNDAPDHAKPVGDWDAEFKKNPTMADHAVQAFQIAMKNSGGDPSAALKAMQSPRQAAFIEKLMGGPEVAADSKTMNAIIKTGLTESVKNDAKLQYEENKRANEQKDIIKRNQPLIDNIVNGGTLDPTSIATMRASDRETIFGEILRRTGGRFSLQALRNMNNLSSEIADKYTVGSFGNQVANIQTAYGHAGAAFDDLQQVKALLPSGNISPYLNRPVNEVIKNLRSVNPQAADALARYQLNLHNATVDWQNLLSNGHALHENEEEYAAKLINDATPFGTAETQLKALMSSAGQRIIPLNERYSNTFSQNGTKVNYPNLIEPQTVDVIRKMNDPLTMQQVARFESGGSNYGGKTGISSPGKQVGLYLAPTAPTKGAKPTPDVYARFVTVYGKTDPGGASSYGTIKQALAANGWDTSALK